MTSPTDDPAWASPHTRAEVPPPPAVSNGAAPARRIRREVDPRSSLGLSRGRIALIIAGILVVVAVCAVITALSATGGGLSNNAAGPSTSTSPAPFFRAPGDLCAEADFTNLRPTFDTLGDLSSEQQDGSAGTAIARCDGSTGNDSVQGTFSFVTMVTPDDAAARRLFEDERVAVRNWARTTDVSGLGAGAYGYVEPGGGITVHAYQANLTIRLSWAPARPGDAAPDGTSSALADTCRATMALLRN